MGIFLTPAGMVRALGSPAWVLCVWLVMGAMALCGALCYGELAARYPEAGGPYAYLREAYGPLVAFLYGWKSLLVMDPGLTAALAVGAASYLGYALTLTAGAARVVAVGFILVLAALNILGVSVGAWLLRWLTALKLGLLSLILLWGFGRGLGNWANFAPLVAQRPGSAPLLSALAAGMVGAFFAFGGWWDVNKIAGEVRDPARTLPRALAGGVLVVTIVYILTSMSFIYLVPLEQVTSDETFAAQVGERLFGRAGGEVFAAVVIVSVLGSLAAVMMAAPRVYFAMARDGLFPPAAARLHPRFATPARAILVQATLATILVALGTFNQIVAYFVFVTVLFIALTVFSLFIFRRTDRHAAAAPSYRTPGYPATPAIFLLLIGLLLALLAGNNPRQALAGVVIVLLGAPVYYLTVRRRQVAPEP